MSAVNSLTFPGTNATPYQHVTLIRVTPVGDRVAGVVEIRTAKKPSHKHKVSRYAIASEPKLGTGRGFKLTKPGGAEHYLTHLNTTNDRHDECTCDGFVGSGTCKHCRALRALLEAGHLA